MKKKSLTDRKRVGWWLPGAEWQEKIDEDSQSEQISSGKMNKFQGKVNIQRGDHS